MEKRNTPLGGRSYLLKRSDAMDGQLYAFGRQGLPIHLVATEFGCHKDTLRSFFQREPDAREFYLKGKSEMQAAAREKERAAAHAYQQQASLRPTAEGTCANCGQKLGSAPAEQTITFSTAELARAREKLDRMFDRMDAKEANDQTEVEEGSPVNEH